MPLHSRLSCGVGVAAAAAGLARRSAGGVRDQSDRQREGDAAERAARHAAHARRQRVAVARPPRPVADHSRAPTCASPTT